MTPEPKKEAKIAEEVDTSQEAVLHRTEIPGSGRSVYGAPEPPSQPFKAEKEAPEEDDKEAPKKDEHKHRR